ncbi:MAG: hypothetical protein KGL39_07190 [Patescibacteria group bacterium]|nr:hypothetical protein [Patescibacteria group bacterium]
MTCRGFQFAIGGEYKHEGSVKACESGFHACEYPLDVLGYYPPASSVYAEVEQDGEIEKHGDDSKVASSVLRVKAAVSLAGLIQAAIDYTFSRSKPEGERATGPRGAASATGTRGAASATGTRGAASATGYAGAASATGDAGAASATGYAGKVKGAKGCALFLVERDTDYNIIAAAAAIVGKTKDIKPDTWYTLKSGKFTEVK